MITTENIHVWKNTQGAIMVSDENIKKLYSFDSYDAAITAIWQLGFTESAKQLHAQQKCEA